jgi:hypothetical protein
MPEDDEKDLVKVDRKTVRSEVGQAPNLPPETYDISVHRANAERIYGVENHVLESALYYLSVTDPEYDAGKLTVVKVQNAINKSQAQQVKE